jgi:hypothetical protein
MHGNSKEIDADSVDDEESNAVLFLNNGVATGGVGGLRGTLSPLQFFFNKQYFSLRINQPSPTSQQYFSLITNQPCWFVMREKYCWLVYSERKVLLAGG